MNPSNRTICVLGVEARATRYALPYRTRYSTLAVPVVCWNPARNFKQAPLGIVPPGTTVEARTVSLPVRLVAGDSFCHDNNRAEAAAGVPSAVHVFAAVQPSQFSPIVASVSKKTSPITQLVGGVVPRAYELLQPQERSTYWLLCNRASSARRGIGIEEGVADHATGWRGCSLSVRPCRAAEESPGVRCCATEPVLSGGGGGIEEGIANYAAGWRSCSLRIRPGTALPRRMQGPGIRGCTTEPVLSRGGRSIEKGIANDAGRRLIWFPEHTTW